MPEADPFTVLQAEPPMMLAELHQILGEQIARGRGDATITVVLPDQVLDLHPTLHNVNWSVDRNGFEHTDVEETGDWQWMFIRLVPELEDRCSGRPLHGAGALPHAASPDCAVTCDNRPCKHGLRHERCSASCVASHPKSTKGSAVRLTVVPPEPAG